MKNTKHIDRCRVCGGQFYKEPLISYKNMPKAAQHLPDKNTLKDDEGVDLTVCQCSDCGLVQLDSSPVDYYKEVIRAAGFSPEMKEFRIRQFSEFIRKYSFTGKKIIEIGCGRGEYLSIMVQSGADAYGLEQSEDLVAQCTKNRLKVSRGFIEEENYKVENSPFDAFFILNFLEHLPDPNSVLKGINKNLANSAVGIVEVPNFDMILRHNLFSEFARDHLFYFTQETLSTTLQLNGFEILECQTVWHDYIISAVVRKRQRKELSAFGEHQIKIVRELKEYVGRFPDKKIAVWGAGHQAFALLSLAGLGDKIRYVIDSAPFKQGKYTPATHIPIVSPDKFFTDSVDAVIVMAGSYSDEVVEIVRTKCNRKIKIAIMREDGLETRK